MLTMLACFNAPGGSVLTRRGPYAADARLPGLPYRNGRALMLMLRVCLGALRVALC